MANGPSGGADSSEDDLPSLISGDEEEEEEEEELSESDSEPSAQSDGDNDAELDDDNPPPLIEDHDDSDMPALVHDTTDENSTDFAEDTSYDEPPNLMSSPDDSGRESDGDDEADENYDDDEEGGTSDAEEYTSEGSESSGSDGGEDSKRKQGEADEHDSFRPHLKRGFLNTNLDKAFKPAAGQAGSSAQNGKREKVTATGRSQASSATTFKADATPRSAARRDFPTGPSPSEGTGFSESLEEWEARRNKLRNEGRLSSLEQASLDAKAKRQEKEQEKARKQEREHEKARREELKKKKLEAEKQREAEIAIRLAEDKRREELERLKREKEEQEALLNAEIGTCRSLDSAKCPNSNALILDSQRHIEVACSDSCIVRCHYPVCWKVMESRKKQDYADWKLQPKAACITPDCPGEIIRALVKEKRKVEYPLVKEEERKKHKDHQDIGCSKRPPRRKMEKLRPKAGPAGPDATTAATTSESLVDEAEEHLARRKYRGHLRAQGPKDPPSVQPAATATAAAAAAPEKAVAGASTGGSSHAASEKEEQAAKALKSARPPAIPKPTGTGESAATRSSQQGPSTSLPAPENGGKAVQPQPIVNMEEAELVVYKKDDEEDILVVGGMAKGKKGKAAKEKKKKTTLHKFNFQPILDGQVESYEAKLERMLAGEEWEEPSLDVPIATFTPPPPRRPAVTAAAEFPPLYPRERTRGAPGASTSAWKESLPSDPIHSYCTDHMSKDLLVSNVDIELEDEDVWRIFREYNPKEMLRFYPQELAVLSFNSMADATSALYIFNNKFINGRTFKCRYLRKVPPWDLYLESEKPSTPPTLQHSISNSLTPISIPITSQGHPETTQPTAPLQPPLPPKYTNGGSDAFKRRSVEIGRSTSLDSANASLSPVRSSASDLSPSPCEKKESRLKADVEPFVPSSRIARVGSPGALVGSPGVLVGSPGGAVGSPGSFVGSPGAATKTETAPPPPPADPAVPDTSASEAHPPVLPPGFPAAAEAADDALDGPPPLATCRYNFGLVVACNHTTLAMYKQMRLFSLPSSNLNHKAPSIRPNNCALFMLNVETLDLYGAYTSNTSGLDLAWVGVMGARAVRESVGFEPIEEFAMPLVREDYEEVFPLGWFPDDWADWSPQLPLTLTDMQAEALLELFGNINYPANDHQELNTSAIAPPVISTLLPPTLPSLSTTNPPAPPTLPPASTLPPPPPPPSKQTLPKAQASSTAAPPPPANPPLAKLTLASPRDRPASPATPLSTTPTELSQATAEQSTAPAEPQAPAINSRPNTPASTVLDSYHSAVDEPLHESNPPASHSPASDRQESFLLREALRPPQAPPPPPHVDKSPSLVAETISALLDPCAPSHEPKTASHAEPAAQPSLATSASNPAPPGLRSRSPLPGPAVGNPPVIPLLTAVMLPATTRPRTASPRTEALPSQSHTSTPPSSVARFADPTATAVQPPGATSSALSQAKPTSRPSTPGVLGFPPGYPPPSSRAPAAAHHINANATAPALAPPERSEGGAGVQPSVLPGTGNHATVTRNGYVVPNLPAEAAPRPASPPRPADHLELFPYLFPKVQPEVPGTSQPPEREQPQVPAPPPPTNVTSMFTTATYNTPAHLMPSTAHVPATTYTPYQPTVQRRPAPYNPLGARPRVPYNPLAASHATSAAPPPAQPTTLASRAPFLFQPALPSAVPVGATTGVGSRPTGTAPSPAFHPPAHPSDHHGQRPPTFVPPPPDSRNSTTLRMDQQAAPSALFLCRYCMTNRSDYLFLSCRHFGPCLACYQTRDISSCLQCGVPCNDKETWQRVFL